MEQPPTAASRPPAGLCLRPLTDEADAARIITVCASAALADAVDPLSTLEGVPTPEEQRAAVRTALARGEADHWLLVETDREPVGYCRVLWWDEADGARVYLHLGAVVPAWRGRGVGTAILNWAEERARQLVAEQQDAERAELAANASETDAAAAALLRAAGYQVGFVMLEMALYLSERPAEPLLPSGIAIRRTLPEHYLAIGESVEEAYRASRGNSRFSVIADPKNYGRGLAGSSQDPTLWQVAWDEREIAGQVLCRVERGRAEVFEVSVRPGWRRRGLARALLARALNTLADRGVTVVRLHTREDNPDRAPDLYQQLGFRTVKRFPRYRKPLSAHLLPSSAPPRST